MRITRKFLTALLALCLIFSMVTPALTVGAETVDSGKCGDNLTWELDSEGTLTISGEGELDFEEDDYIAPWDEYCEDIISVVIEDGVTSIGVWTFVGCNSLTNVTIPDSVTSIARGAFSDCFNLTSITIPASVTSIEDSAFVNCYSIEGFWVDENNPSYSSDDYGVWFNKDKTVLIKAPRQLSGEYIIPDSVTDISDGAFEGFESLTSVTIPDSVTDIGDNAFFWCLNLTSITFNGDAPKIGEDCFYGITATAYYPANNATWTDKVMQDYGGKITWLSYRASGDIVVNGECGNNLTWELDIEGTLTIFGTGEMEDFLYYDNYDYYPTPWEGFKYQIKAVVIRDGITNIGKYAFENCKILTSVIIGDSVTSIGENAFSGCMNLTSVTIPDSVISIGDSAFSDCVCLNSVHIGNSVTSIGYGAFSYCENLFSVVIPDSVTSIGEGAFSDCRSLMSVNIGNRVTSIGDYAFSYCENLTNVIIPDSVISIGNYAFAGCKSLNTIKYVGDKPKIGENCFLESGIETQRSEIVGNVVVFGVILLLVIGVFVLIMYKKKHKKQIEISNENLY